MHVVFFFFFFQAEDGIRDDLVTGVQTCALPIFTDARDDAIGKGITINGLVILTPPGQSFRPEHTDPPGGLEKYFQDNVIGGFRPFSVVVAGHESFRCRPAAKTIRGVARSPPPPPPPPPPLTSSLPPQPAH